MPRYSKKWNPVNTFPKAGERLMLTNEIDLWYGVFGVKGYESELPDHQNRFPSHWAYPPQMEEQEA